MPSDLERRIAGLYRTPPAPSDAHRDALQARLLAAWPEPTPMVPALAARASRRRWWLGGLVFAGALAGACVLPVEYEMPLGRHVRIEVQGMTESELDPHTIAEFIQTEYDAKHIEISMTREQDGAAPPHLRIDLLAFGAQDMPDDLAEDLVDAFPRLAEGHVEDEPVEGMVEGTLGGKLGHDWLDIVIDAHGVEEARRRVLAELAARGIEGEASVEIVDEPGRREVKVRVESKDPLP